MIIRFSKQNIKAGWYNVEANKGLVVILAVFSMIVISSQECPEVSAVTDSLFIEFAEDETTINNCMGCAKCTTLRFY
jgi:hypothetical protein